MNLLFKVLLTLNATLWVIVMYAIKEDLTYFSLPSLVSSIILLFIPVISSAISLYCIPYLGKDNIEIDGIAQEEYYSFLPIYLGYFFVGLSVDKLQHLVFVYIMIFMFTFLSRAEYFNPIYLLFGYGYYHAETKNGIRVFLITKKRICNEKNAKFENLRRINDTTYIMEGK